MSDELSLEDLLHRYRLEWKQWISTLRSGDMVRLKIDSDAIAVVGTREDVTGVVLCVRNLPMNVKTGTVDTVLDVYINTPKDGTETPRGHMILGYVDVRELSLISRGEV